MSIAVQDVRKHLGLTPNQDAELSGFIDAAVELIEQRVGPLTERTVTARVATAGALIILPSAPAVSIASLSDADEYALDVDDLHLDTAAGIVTRNDGGRLCSRYYTVTYVAGRSTLPAHLALAVKELVRHLWKTQRGAAPAGRADELDPLGAFSLPGRVLELIERDTIIGFA